MVDFDNIEVIDGYIEADAYVETEGIREHIRAKIDGTYQLITDPCNNCRYS